MCDIVWIFPQSHSSLLVKPHFLWHALQWPWPVWKRFCSDHWCLWRSKPGSRVVGSTTKVELTTVADCQSSLHRLVTSIDCKSLHNGLRDSRGSGGGWKQQPICQQPSMKSLAPLQYHGNSAARWHLLIPTMASMALLLTHSFLMSTEVAHTKLIGFHSSQLQTHLNTVLWWWHTWPVALKILPDASRWRGLGNGLMQDSHHYYHLLAKSGWKLKSVEMLWDVISLPHMGFGVPCWRGVAGHCLGRPAWRVSEFTHWTSIQFLWEILIDAAPEPDIWGIIISRNTSPMSLTN